MIRSGRIRSALRTRRRIVTSPRPSRFGGRASSRTTCGWRSRSSAASSIVTTRSLSPTKLDSTFSVVVLPEPVPPQTNTLARARTARARKSSRPGPSVPFSTRSSGESPWRRKRRIVNAGPSSASGGSTTFTRDPSGSRASHSGSDSSARRPSGARIRSIASRRSASRSKRTPVHSSRPRRSTHTGAVPDTMISSTAGSASSGSSGPRPNARWAIRAASSTRRSSLSTPASRSTNDADPAGQVTLPVARSREQPFTQVAGECLEWIHDT